MKVKTDYKGSEVFTAGKEYTIIEKEGNTAFYIKDDFGKEQFCLFFGCAFLEGSDWIIIDEKESLPASEQTNTGTMSLRDHFAGLAMQGWFSSFSPEEDHPSKTGMAEDIAHLSYRVADAMLKAREEK